MKAQEDAAPPVTVAYAVHLSAPGKETNVAQLICCHEGVMFDHMIKCRGGKTPYFFP